MQTKQVKGPGMNRVLKIWGYEGLSFEIKESWIQGCT